jgi:hypothetical protein
MEILEDEDRGNVDAEANRRGPQFSSIEAEVIRQLSKAKFADKNCSFI